MWDADSDNDANLIVVLTGSLPLRDDRDRWLAYMNDAIIGPSILNDVIGLERITKPALMKALLSLGSAYSAQELSYRKIMGQLDDVGNTTTIAHYLDVLSDAGLLTGVQKYSDKTIKRRASSPRLAVHDTSLMTVSYGPTRDMLLTDHNKRGHLVESAVDAYLLRRSISEGFGVSRSAYCSETIGPRPGWCSGAAARRAA
ncbi:MULTISPECIES: DUF4143 domain-containing protein [Bifidobacterium]|uniref:DUF4143 domain-containing protein n=1 Tax=Bifidobacterium TaxID=1678 RepID=UPI001BDD4958|nr:MULTISPECIES: DUF4143 domain-containing protein [Bifidobacterium]MBT1162011.1 DUF4143 domain-containing protein [Bifidobacterium sp. SO1]MBW3079080.1 DUF4143 domain-containing protein [Bifidobacterium simiiventris]